MSNKAARKLREQIVKAVTRIEVDAATGRRTIEGQETAAALSHLLSLALREAAEAQKEKDAKVAEGFKRIRNNRVYTHAACDDIAAAIRRSK